MTNPKYEKAAQLRQVCDLQMAQVLPLLAELKQNFADFYELMRWQNLGCTTEEYEKLYENRIYPYEENHIDYRLEQVIDFFHSCNSETSN